MVVYHNALAGPGDLAGFRLEGEGAMTFPLSRLRLESLRPAEQGQDANIVLWCPEEFGPDVAVSWDFWPVREPGLAIMFFHARGHSDRNVLDPSLRPRTGSYDQYHHGDLDAYHVSYFRRRWDAERRFHTCNLRKSHGFHLVAQGADPLPTVVDADGPYRITITVRGGRITFAVDGLVCLDWVDDGTVGGPPLAGGKIGLRQMAPMIGEYADLRVVSL